MEKKEGQPAPAGEVRPEDAARRLAELHPLEYDQCRKEQAKTLGVRVPVLDAEVQKQRLAAQEQERAEAPGLFREVARAADSMEPLDLQEAVEVGIRRHLFVAKEVSFLMSLWVLGSYAFDAFRVFPYLLFSSAVKGCGKSTALDLLHALCDRTVLAGNITGAAIFRLIEASRPTLLIDEADTFVKFRPELHGILNSGNKWNGGAIRVVGDDHEPKGFSTWCPKAIAGIGDLQDTLEDRSLVVRMERMKPGDHVKPLDDAAQVKLEGLASHCKRWAADHFAELRDARPELPPQLINRAADNARPIVAVAACISPALAKQAVDAFLRLRKDSKDRSELVQLLEDIHCVFGRGVSFVKSDNLVANLNGMEERPWGEWKGKGLTPHSLARLLKRLEIKPGHSRDGNTRGYCRQVFEDAWARYLPPDSETASEASRPSVHTDGSDGLDGCSGAPGGEQYEL